MSTAITLAGLLIPFALITFAVLSLIRRTEDDELIERLRHDADPAGDDLQGWLTTLRNECELGPYDAPTEPVLDAWDRAKASP